MAELDELLTIEDPRERLAALIRYQITVVAREPDLFAVFFDNAPRLEKKYRAEIRARERKYLDGFRSAVQGAVDAGVIQVSDVTYAMRAIHTMTTWIYKWIRPGDDPELLADNCIALILGPAPEPAARAGRVSAPSRSGSRAAHPSS